MSTPIPASTPGPFNSPPSSPSSAAGQQHPPFSQDVLQAAQKHVVEPAREAVESARTFAKDAYQKTAEQVGRQVSQAEEFATKKFDQTTHWVETNPWPAVTAGFMVGLVLGASLVSSRR